MSTLAQINLKALTHNLAIAKAQAPTARILAVIKANAYGHGMVQVATALAAADGYAVANINEGIRLRKHGINKKIVILQGFSGEEGLRAIRAHQLTPVIHTVEQRVIASKYEGEKVPVWMKIDTGMGRLGLSPLEYQDYMASDKSNTIQVECVMTHFASADELTNDKTRHQTHLFKTLVSETDTTSMANSAGLMGWSERLPELAEGWIRPGIMLYGISSFADQTAQKLGLQPVLTLTAPLIAINRHKKDDTIGYSEDWQCPEDMPVGVVAIGYGDGYPRHLKAGTSVLLRGKRVTIIGRVSMDMLCLDLRGHEDVTIGDRVTCWGEGLPVEEVALQAGTIPYELMCQLTGRVKRVYSNG